MKESEEAKEQISTFQRRKYMKIAFCLWTYGPETAHEDYPTISVEEFVRANEYYDSLRCEGCYCGSCVNLPELARNLDKSPEPLIPIARLAEKLGLKDYEDIVKNKK